MKTTSIFFLFIAVVMAGCTKIDNENGGGNNWKPNLGDYDPVPLSDFDNDFYKWCVREFDATGDGILQYGEIKKIERIHFSWDGYEPRLESLNGIKYFTSLRYLYDYSGWMCEDMRTLDVSYNLMLDTLRLGSKPKLRHLTLGNKPHLKYLHLQSHLMPTIDLSKCPELEELIINNISFIDLSKCTKLKDLSIGSDDLTSLELPCPLLESISCHLPALRTMDISACKNLIALNSFYGCNDLETLYVWKGWSENPPTYYIPDGVQIIEK